MAIIKVSELHKSYNRGKVEALRGVTLEVEEGEVYGLIGPDGAGKTTLFRILATLLAADSGEAMVDGCDVKRDYRRIRRQIGYMPGKFSLYQDMSVRENMEFFATVHHTTIEENYDLVKEIYSQIEKFSDRKAGKLSGGMKQKLALSCALIHAPRVLLLDEPTTGVDPVSRREFWQMLHKLKDLHGITILVSTPYMDEAMQCDRIALIQNGEIMQIDTPQGIIDFYDWELWSVSSERMHALLGDLREMPMVMGAFSFGESYHVTLREGGNIESLREELVAKGHQEIRIEPTQAGIEDCFMALMKRERQAQR
ncbi:MAG: ABC transporter ATP-binding protein [Lepagella sp.]